MHVVHRQTCRKKKPTHRIKQVKLEKKKKSLWFIKAGESSCHAVNVLLSFRVLTPRGGAGYWITTQGDYHPTAPTAMRIKPENVYGKHQQINQPKFKIWGDARLMEK